MNSAKAIFKSIARISKDTQDAQKQAEWNRRKLAELGELHPRILESKQFFEALLELLNGELFVTDGMMLFPTRKFVARIKMRTIQDLSRSPWGIPPYSKLDTLESVREAVRLLLRLSLAMTIERVVELQGLSQLAGAILRDPNMLEFLGSLIEESVSVIAIPIPKQKVRN